MDGVDGEWLSADCSMGKARLGGGAIGRNPTDRGKAGSKKSILVEGAGGPLSVEAAWRNHIEVARSLVEAGADTLLPCTTGEAVVSEAGWRGHSQLLEVLATATSQGNSN